MATEPSTPAPPEREPNLRIRYRQTDMVNGQHIPREPGDETADYEVWTQLRPGRPWIMRGWVYRNDGWMAIPVNPGPLDEWTTRLKTRAAATRELLRRWPDHAGAERPDPDADSTDAWPDPAAPTFERATAIIAKAEQERKIPRHCTWRGESEGIGRLAHIGIPDAETWDIYGNRLKLLGLTCHTVTQIRGRAFLQIVIAPAETRRRRA
jgi:hypothetical protein